MSNEIKAERGFTLWWSTNRRAFVATVGGTSLLICLVAVFAGLDRVLHTGIQALATVVALPFLVALALILLVVLPFLPFLLLSALADADIDIPGGDAVMEGAGKHIVAPYYRWIGKQRSPIFWGIPCGVVLALVCLATIGYVRAVPVRAAAADAERKTFRTRDRLHQVRRDISAEFARTSSLPQTLTLSDAFGRPMTYAMIESRSSSSYAVTSLGADGVPSGDDLCVGEIFHRNESALKKLTRRVLRGPEPQPARCSDAAAANAVKRD